MPLNNSHGVFTSSKSMRSFSQGDLHRLYWATTNERHIAVRPPTEADQNETYSEVHNIGRRPTKYLAFQKREAPLLGRSACSHTSEYMAKPAIDYEYNAAKAELLKTRGNLHVGTPCNMEHVSHYNEHIGSTSFRPAVCARGARITREGKQERTDTIGGVSIPVTKSHAHRTHTGHSSGGGSMTKQDFLPRPELVMSTTLRHGVSDGDLVKSTYHREHQETAQSLELVPTGTRPTMKQVLSASGLRPTTPDKQAAAQMPAMSDHPVFQKRRMPFLPRGY
mmetsp:Transcript_99621/g.257426  ORF Transcript_99621/g.257426 Transcript_99621/m.257426 type:complete len:279 (+) Transcript_99621:338-1174(+)